MATVAAAMAPSGSPLSPAPTSAASSLGSSAEGAAGVAARFASAVFTASQSQLTGAGLGPAARLAGALATAGVAAPLPWLAALQTTTAGEPKGSVLLLFEECALFTLHQGSAGAGEREWSVKSSCEGACVPVPSIHSNSTLHLGRNVKMWKHKKQKVKLGGRNTEVFLPP